MEGLHLVPSAACSAAGPCVINVYINYERKFAFVELRTGVRQTADYSYVLI